MNVKYTSDEYVIEEDKFKVNSNFLNELYDEDSDIIHDLVNVKRVFFKKEERWDIYLNKKVVLKLIGKRFVKKEREFLRTPNGMMFIINEFKSGCKTCSDFKRKIKKYV